MQEKVSIVKTTGVDIDPLRKAVKQAVDLLDSPLAGIGPGSRVVIKPNITAENVSWHQGVVSNPNLIRAIVEMVLEFKPKEVLIAEAIAVGLDVKKGFAFLGYDKIARETGAKLIDLYDEKFIQVPVKDAKLHRTIEVARTVLEADYLIVVPVMKTHVAAGISVCMKCLMGTISAEQKKKFHFYGLAQSIVELNSIVEPDLFIVDGSVAGQGDGPMSNEPVGLQVVMAGINPRAIDTTAARVMGFEPNEIDVLRLADEKWGPIPESSIQVLGEAPDRIAKPFRRAADRVTPREDIEFINGNACPTCEGILQLALARAEKMDKLQKLLPLRFILGPDAVPPDRERKNLVMGRCLSHLKETGYYVPGCPPQVFLVTDELRQMAGLDRLAGSREDFMFTDEEVLK